jgi:Ca2+-binding RTX toxin-like protein
MSNTLDYSRYTLEFSDEFDNFSMWSESNPTGTWRTTYTWGQRTLAGNGEEQLYVDPEYKDLGLDPFSVADGVLTITAAPTADDLVDDLGGYQYTSGLITSEESFSQTYGYFEMQAELPAGQGLWPAFWLLPTHRGWPPEIDIFEVLGDEPGVLNNAIHSDDDAPRNKAYATDVGDLSDGMHTYGMEWTALTIGFYLDGVEVARAATPSDMHTPMYILANLAVGGNWPGSPDDTTGFPADFDIDYIRAYSVNEDYSALKDRWGEGGAISATLTGTSGGDTLVGTDLAEKLAGGGGNDTLIGGNGDDTYEFSGGQIIQEEAGGGYDALHTVAYETILPDNVEKMVMLKGAYAGHGNDLDNRMMGSTKDNVIDGGGGDDLLFGQGGRDTFVIAAGAGSDLIGDFDGDDTIEMRGLFGSFEDMLASTTEVNGDVVIDLGDGETLTLLRTNLADLSAGQFVYLDLEAGDTVQLTLPCSAPSDHEFLGTSGVDVLVGTDGADFFHGKGGQDTFLGGGGDDTYIVSNAGEVVVETASGGVDTIQSWCSGTFALPENVENLALYTGSGRGNDLSNIINGSSGANTLDGGKGNDWLAGQDGRDTFIIRAGEGSDVIADLSADDKVILVGAYADFETMIADARQIGRDVVLPVGEGEVLTLRGVGVASLTASQFVFQSPAGEPPAWPDAGDDPTPEPEPGPEPAAPMWTASGPAEAHLTGTAAADVLTGSDGNDFFWGKGGADRFIGGHGDDTYVISNAGETVVEAADGGIDTVKSWRGSYTLDAHVENLEILGRDGIGNDLDNWITGSSGANIIDGGGGDDLLAGGGGADTFVVRIGDGSDSIVDFAADDRVVLDGFDPSAAFENAHQVGGDVVIDLSASQSLTLRDVQVADLTAGQFVHVDDVDGIDPAPEYRKPLVLPEATAPERTVNGTSAAETLTGTSQHEKLHGAGGADVLVGGDGDDTYVVSDAGETVIEAPHEGIDVVLSWAKTYTLTDHVENLTVLQGHGTGYGNGGDNLLRGSDGSQALHGGDGNDLLDGGKGADDLWGGAGDDTFVIHDLTEAGDRIHDFAVGSDILDLRAMMDSLGYDGADPLGDGWATLVATADGATDVLAGAPGGQDLICTLFDVTPDTLCAQEDIWFA